MKSIVKRIFKKVFPDKAYVNYSGYRLPLPENRLCGKEMLDNAAYLQSARNEADRLIRHFHLGRDHRVLDLGCGQGRLALGFFQKLPQLAYTGVDINSENLQWCRAYLQPRNPHFQFLLLNVYNERYNTNGQPLDSNFRFAFDDSSFDVINLFSVFSHMMEDEMVIYLRELKRLLAPEGGIFFTTFAEDNVPDFEINPKGYVFDDFDGPLHVVRYNFSYLENLLRENGFQIVHATRGEEIDGQTGFFLKHREKQQQR